MAAALQMVGFEVWDVNMQDLSSGSVSLDQFRGIVFVGGFSYADVFGSAKGNRPLTIFLDCFIARCIIKPKSVSCCMKR
jgi:phosphoribosylformylglycinamidine (FGAM) synthase-like amidotransferase family enzyme